MEAGNTPQTPSRPPGGGGQLSGEEIRRATFPQALRGYDRQAVHDMLDRVADWVEGVASATPGMREEFARVGEKTAGILTAAEEAARNLREEAIEYADRLRADAEDESRKSRLNASQKMDEMVAEAETKAQRIIDEAVERRRQLNLAISSLIDRRDEIAADATRLAEELLGAVEGVRRPEPPQEEEDDDFSLPAAGAAASLAEEPTPDPAASEEETGVEGIADLEDEPPSEELTPEGLDAKPPTEDEEETQFHPGPDSEDFEDDNPETRRRPTLLVDPDEED